MQAISACMSNLSMLQLCLRVHIWRRKQASTVSWPIKVGNVALITLDQ